jgi:PAS domain S-box-containing protein
MFESGNTLWKKPFERAFHGETITVTATQQLATGDIFTETHYHPIRENSGAIQGVAVFVQNVTSRNHTESQLEKLLAEANLKTEEMKAQESVLLDTLAEIQQSQDALQQKEAHLSAVINNTDDKIVAIDTNYTITFINSSLTDECASKGIFLKEGSDYRKIFEGVDEKEWKPNYERAFAGEKFVLHQVQNLLNEGVLEVAFNPVKNKKGLVTGICIFVHDVTPQVKAEQQLQKSYAIEQEANEELQAQQEELRQNLEELMSTQEELEKTQHILRLKEARLRALINNTGDAIFSVDTQYNITVINQVMNELYRLRYSTAGEGVNFLQYLPEDKKHMWKKCFDKALQGNQFVVTWEDTPHSDNIYHELSFNPVKTDTHDIVGVSVFIKDITERRRQELEKSKLLREAEEREEELMAQGEMMRDNLYELMITRDELEKKEAQLSSQMTAINKSNNIIEFDLQGKILHANDSFLQLVGYSKEELTGKDYRILIPEDEQDLETNMYLWSKLSQGEFCAGEYRRVKKTGEAVWIKATYNPVCDEHGKPYKIVKFAFDITDRVQDSIEKKGLYEKISLDAEELRMQEEELRQNLEELKITQEVLLQQKEHIQDKEARLRALIDNTEDDIYAIDTNYAITILNKAIKTRYEKQGLTLQTGYNIFSTIPAAATAYWKVNFDKAIAGEKFSIVDQVITKDGEVYYDVSLNPIRNDRNQVIGVSVLSRNINQYKMAEKENLQTIDVLRKIQERVASMSSDKEGEIEEYKRKVEKLKSEMNKKIKV